MDIKSTLETLKDKATDLAQASVAETKRLAEIAKLKTANMAEEDTIKKAYVELGKLYYAEHGATPDGAYAAACERVTASKAVIETNNERIAELKTSNSAEPAAEEAEEPVEGVLEAVEAAEEVVEAAEEAVEAAETPCSCSCEEEKQD